MALLQASDVSLRLLPAPYLLASVAVAAVLASYLLSWYRLRHIPGPVLAGLSYLWLLRTTTTWEQYDRFGALFARHGKLVRIGPNDVITANPELLRRISAVRSKYERADYYVAARINPHEPSLVNLTNNRAHDRLKGQMAHGYGGREVPTLEADVDAQVGRLVSVLRSRYASSPTFAPADLASLVQYLTLDVITKIAYGKEFGYLENETDVNGYISSSCLQIKLAAVCAEIPIFRILFTNSFVLGLFGPKPTDQTGLGNLIGLAREVVANRFRPDAEDQRDMLGSFIRHGVSKSQCESEIPFQIIAGSDTTAHAIRGTLLYLMSSPQAYSALQREIDEAAARGSISKPATTAQAKQLPYLQAVIYEGLRMNPPSSHLMMKAIPPEGETVDGYFIPGGTRIATNMKPIMRDPETFGGDADVFNPARWLGLEPAQRKRMVDTVELVFGSGRWGCSGKTVAYVELNKTFVELFRNFDLQLVNPRRPIDESRNIQVWIEKGMWAKVTDREAVSATVSEKVPE